MKVADVIEVITTLLRTAKRKAVHFGLDLYIILLSGMRFQADQLGIREAILELLRRNRSKGEDQKLDLVYTLVVRKTNRRQDVCLNTQLVRLLLKF